MAVDRNEARRLYKLALEQLASLDLQLFAFDEADQLGLNEAEQDKKMHTILKSATDTMNALARVDTIAQALVTEVDKAVKDALRDPTDVASIKINDDECHEADAYVHVLVLQALAARLAAVYGLDVEEKKYGLTTPQALLQHICENVGNSILSLINKKMIETPKSEHHVKHLLFAFVRAAFPDALPDGQVSFPSPLKGHVPDLSVPLIKVCIETKVARSKADLSTVIDGLLGDISTYGSSDYTTFFAVIYTNESALTQVLLEQVIDERKQLSGINPKYHWKWILVHGPLAPIGGKTVPTK